MTNLPKDPSTNAVGEVSPMKEPTQTIPSKQTTKSHDYSFLYDASDTTTIPRTSTVPKKNGELKISATSKTTAAPTTTPLLKTAGALNTTAATKTNAPQKITVGLKQDVVHMSNHKVIRQNFGRHVVHIFPYPAPKRKIKRKKTGKTSDHRFQTLKLK